jgi:hypothetical protein
MGTETTASLIAYLRSLAPEFFAARMRGASEAEILQLEKAAGLRMSDGHREFLRAMGNTAARVLNPFLNDCDFCIATLMTEYEYLRRERTSLPPSVVYFSSSDITGSNIFLRHGADSSDDPEIGDLAAKTGQFILLDAGHFEGYLQWHAFHFRRKQLDHEIHVRPVWNEDEERWEGHPRKCRELLEAQGFQRLFIVGNYSECFEHAGVAAALYHDGAMSMAGDDPDELRRRAEAMASETKLVIEPVPRLGRLRAPRQ